jgi:hypothetical protein
MAAVLASFPAADAAGERALSRCLGLRGKSTGNGVAICTNTAIALSRSMILRMCDPFVER